MIKQQQNPSSVHCADTGFSPKALEAVGKHWRVVSDTIEVTRRDWRLTANAVSHLCGLVHEFSLATGSAILYLLYIKGYFFSLIDFVL